MIALIFKQSIRGLIKQKLFSFTSVFNLAICITFILLAYGFIKDELTYDHWHKRADRTFVVYQKSYYNENKDDRDVSGTSFILPMSTAQYVKEESAEVEYATPLSIYPDAIVVRANDQVTTESVTYTYPDLFKIFDFEPVYGNYDQFLTGEKDAILTESVALKLFGEINPIGKDIEIALNNEPIPLTVTGVIKDAPKNSNIAYAGIIVRMERRNGYAEALKSWNIGYTNVIVSLKDQNLDQQFKIFLKELYLSKIENPLRQLLKERNIEFTRFGNIDITPLATLHLNEKLNWPGSSKIIYSYLLGVITLFVLLITTFNYLGHAFANFSARSASISILRYVGSSKIQLFTHFMTETVILATGALLLSFLIFFSITPVFGSITQKSLTEIISPFEWIVISICIMVLITLIVGSYPALKLSTIQPDRLIRNKRLKSTTGAKLIGFQLIITTILLTATLFISKQLSFITTKDLGFEHKNIIYFDTHTGHNENGNRLVKQFSNAVAGNELIQEVAGTSSAFHVGFSWQDYTAENGSQFNIYYIGADANYISTFGLKLKDGRVFRDDLENNNEAIINKMFAEKMGWDQPIGMTFNKREIVGVIEDFHFQSLEEDIQPLMILPDFTTSVVVRFDPNRPKEALEYLQATWESLNTEKPFDYRFLDDVITRQYFNYFKWRKIILISSILAGLMCSIGILGFTVNIFQSREKELGIRKVFGAGLNSILKLTNGVFLKLIFWSLVISFPVVYWLFGKWTELFAYAIAPDFSLYFNIITFQILIIIGSSLYSVLRISNLNPTEILRNE